MVFGPYPANLKTAKKTMNRERKWHKSKFVTWCKESNRIYMNIILCGILSLGT